MSRENKSSYRKDIRFPMDVWNEIKDEENVSRFVIDAVRLALYHKDLHERIKAGSEDVFKQLDDALEAHKNKVCNSSI